MTVRIITGDAIEQLRLLPDQSVHCCVCSPPYFGLRDYGAAGQIGLESSPDEYVESLVCVFREVRRVLRQDGTAWINLGDSYANDGKWGGSSGGKHVTALHGKTGVGRQKVTTGLKPKDLIGIPWMVAFAFRADGWYLRRDIIWHKPNPMPESVRDRPTSAHEYLFLLSKSARYFYDAEAIKESAVATDPGAFDGGPQRLPDGTNANDGRNYRPRTAGNKSHKYVKEYENSASEEHRTKAGLLKVADVPWFSRNKRSVWTIATSPYPDAHFATFPPDLVEPCIKAGTSERGVCAACGAPWVRVTEQQDTGLKQKMADGWMTGPGAHGTIHADGRSAGETGVPVIATVTTGWQPSCSCDAATVPATILDPFGGAGTTGLVADRLGRDAVLIELNPDYAEMARRRIADDAGLFARVAAE